MVKNATSGPSRPFSLRLRLLLVASAVLLIALGLVGYAIGKANQQSAVQALQMRMESHVYLALAAAEVSPQGELTVADDLADPLLSSPASGTYVRIQGENSNWTSPSALGIELPRQGTIAAGQTRFVEPGVDEDYYIYQFGLAWQLGADKRSQAGSDEIIVPFTVSVWVDSNELLRQTEAFRQGLFGTLLLAGVILLIAQVLLIILGFRPLQKVAQDVARVETGEAPALQGSYPRELEPLARNVNRLLSTEKANQQRYRNALDSLAHSLKTPLAILTAGLESDSSRSRASMHKAVADMNRLVATRLQRAAVSARRTMAPGISVKAEARRVLASMEKVYAPRKMVTELTVPSQLCFYGEQRDLLEILGNLIDNAFKYGNSRIAIRASALQPELEQSNPRMAGMRLDVEDDGPGIDQDRWPELLQRGVRGDEHAQGHGLGLAIVQELVTAYGGSLLIEPGKLGGSRVRIDIQSF